MSYVDDGRCATWRGPGLACALPLAARLAAGQRWQRRASGCGAAAAVARLRLWRGCGCGAAGPIAPSGLKTAVDVPRTAPDGGRSADISPAWRVGGSTTVWESVWTVVDVRRAASDGGRSADISPAWRVGGSTTVWESAWTVVDLPSSREPPTVAERPPSTRSARRWPLHHHDTPAKCRRIDHRLAQFGADRPSSGSVGGGSTIVWVGWGRIDHRQIRALAPVPRGQPHKEDPAVRRLHRRVGL